MEQLIDVLYLILFSFVTFPFLLYLSFLNPYIAKGVLEISKTVLYNKGGYPYFLGHHG